MSTLKVLKSAVPPPAETGTGTPKPENQVRIWGKVSITAAQNIHRPNLPFCSADPWFRSASPASTRATSAATGANPSNKPIPSLIICIVEDRKCWANGGRPRHPPRRRDCTLGNAARALLDPELQQSGQARYGQES